MKGDKNMTEDYDELCDEEKSFLEWFNKQDTLNKDFFDMIRHSYMHGYAAGFQAKLKHLSEEQLQK
jgi:hypothetical protein